MKKLKFELSYFRPYTLRYHEDANGALRSFWVDGKPVAIRLTQPRANGRVYAEVYSDQHIGAIADDLQKAAEHMIGAGDDLVAFRTAIMGDRHLARLVDALPGYKPMRGPDLWTMMLSSLVAQQISGAAARSIRARLARRFGHVVDAAGDEVPVLPDAQTVAALSEAQLREVGFSQRKAEYARGMAQALLNGTIIADELRRLSPDEMIVKLSSLRGVGVWTAECIGIFCLGHLDLLPADDLGVQKAVARVYGLKTDPKPKELRVRGEKWRPWRSYATAYFWAGLNTGLLR